MLNVGLKQHKAKHMGTQAKNCTHTHVLCCVVDTVTSPEPQQGIVAILFSSPSLSHTLCAQACVCLYGNAAGLQSPLAVLANTPHVSTAPLQQQQQQHSELSLPAPQQSPVQPSISLSRQPVYPCRRNSLFIPLCCPPVISLLVPFTLLLARLFEAPSAAFLLFYSYFLIQTQQQETRKSLCKRGSKKKVIACKDGTLELIGKDDTDLSAKLAKSLGASVIVKSLSLFFFIFF